eukprot:COSAG01_NODE_434_length_17079_cov_11.829270_9_plen_163_part_00
MYRSEYADSAAEDSAAENERVRHTGLGELQLEPDWALSEAGSITTSDAYVESELASAATTDVMQERRELLQQVGAYHLVDAPASTVSTCSLISTHHSADRHTFSIIPRMRTGWDGGLAHTDARDFGVTQSGTRGGGSDGHHGSVGCGSSCRGTAQGSQNNRR